MNMATDGKLSVTGQDKLRTEFKGKKYWDWDVTWWYSVLAGHP